jgi:hypothetical protein
MAVVRWVAVARARALPGPAAWPAPSAGCLLEAQPGEWPGSLLGAQPPAPAALRPCAVPRAVLWAVRRGRSGRRDVARPEALAEPAAGAGPVRAGRCSALDGADRRAAGPPAAAAQAQAAASAAVAAVDAAPPGSARPAAAGALAWLGVAPPGAAAAGLQAAEPAAGGRRRCRRAADWARSPPSPPVHARRPPPSRRFRTHMFANFPCVAHFFHRNALSPRKYWPQNESNYGERLDATPADPFRYGINQGTPTKKRRGYDARRKISDALVPPKPNEFDSATLISRLRALCGTRSIGVSTDGLSRLSVGGTTWSRIARME